MKYTNIILTGIFTLMLFNWLDINLINNANADLEGYDLRPIENALNNIASAIRRVSINIQ